MRMNNHIPTVKWLSIALLAMVFLTVACESDDFKGKHCLGMFLQWNDPQDDTTTVSNVHIWIYKPDGTLTTDYELAHKNKLNYWPDPLDKGQYLVVATLNMTAPFISEMTNGTRQGDNFAADRILFRLDKPQSAPFHAHYGTKLVTLNGDRLQPTEIDMHRILAELTITIEGLPDGTTVTGVINNAASGIYPARKNNEGAYGQTVNKTLPFTLPSATSQAGMLQLPLARVMPTLQSDEESDITLIITDATGSSTDYHMSAPPIKIAGRYILTMKYAEMHSEMHVSAYNINNWTEGWIIDGEILNPAD